MASPRLAHWLSVLALVLVGCRPDTSDSDAAPPDEGALAVDAPGAEAARPQGAPVIGSHTHLRGSALARTPDEHHLLVADEDHRVLRVVPLPVDVQHPAWELSLPGAPAQLVALEDRVLVTIREPGLLLELGWDQGRLRERGRAELPWDAWGLAVSPDGRTAVVTSAWTHQISGVDLASLAVRWSLNAAREPRGVEIGTDQTAYVSHLVGSAVTRIHGIDGGAPSLEQQIVAPAPLRARADQLLDASLGYALTLSPKGDRLFLPRHALGAQGVDWWFGAGAVDVVTSADLAELAPSAPAGSWADFATGALLDTSAAVALQPTPFVQPRDALYRPTTNTLLVASEGTNELVELDARALDPVLAVVRKVQLGTTERNEYPNTNVVTSGGAPTAIALSVDEKTAWVFCRSTYDLAIVSLDQEGPIPFVHLADDLLDDTAARGRRLFYDATDGVISGGLGCAGCHPEGRDDGHVWHEIAEPENDRANGYRGATVLTRSYGEGPAFVAHAGLGRQTPMLAGRLSLQGPYGWLGEAPSLDARLREGFNLHRWGGVRENPYAVTLDRPKLLAAFVRQGLVAPRLPDRPLTELEERGRAVFEDAAVGCASCHNPKTTFQNGATALLDRPQHPGFDPEPSAAFKTPSLLFVGGTPPYFHDGAAVSLEDLVRKNGISMGDTSRLHEEDKTALAAYLRTIGGYVAPFPQDAPQPRKVATARASKLRAGRPPQRVRWNIAETFEVPGVPCSLKRIDRFIQIACSPGDGISRLAGGTASVDGWVYTTPDDFFGGAPRSVFPLQPGDRRIYQLTSQESVGRWGTRTVPNGVLQLLWDEGEPEPTIIFGR